MVKLKKKLSTKHFILSHLVILILGLSFLCGLYYILNIQYQKSTNPFLNGPVTTPPKTLRMELDQPGDDTLTFQPSIIVSGKTGPALDVLISQQSNDQMIKSKPDGTFSIIINLDEGINNISATVFDATGDTKSATREVYYSKEKI